MPTDPVILEAAEVEAAHCAMGENQIGREPPNPAVPASLQVNRVHFPVTTLGFGRRISIWTQGCSIRCPGCVSKDTWEPRIESSMVVGDLLQSLAPWLAVADGVTISGGEPFDQPAGLFALLTQLRANFAGDLLVFSGYSRATLDARHAEVLRLLDVLITEPFDAAAGQTLALRGSDNQRVFLLTELARQRYPAQLDTQPCDKHRRLDVVVDGAEIWMAGIPRLGDLGKLREELAARGFTCRGSDQPQPFVRA